MDVCLVGGGVMGLLSAFLLARQGFSVALVDRGKVGLESSWAGGGIVSPLYPWRYPPAVDALARPALLFYRSLAGWLKSHADIDPELEMTGLYWLDLEDEPRALDWARQAGVSLTCLDVSSVSRDIPFDRYGYRRALHLSEVANIRNPRLVRALRTALREKASVRILECSQVVDFIREGGRVVGVKTVFEELLAERTVITAGAWSGELLATLGLSLPVEPVKGQMILYKCEPDYLPAMVLAEGRYAIPRRDGHVLVGSTLEHVGFDKTPTGDALASLKASAEKMLPGLAQREVVGHWAGLRPGSPDGIPFIGEVPELPGLWLNCGHYRNGLVLAPASCELLKNLMLGEAPIVDPAPYSPAGRLRAL